MGKYADGKVTAEQAAKELHMSTDCLRQGMIRDTLPIHLGMVTKANKNYSYHIYRKPLDELKERWGVK